MKNKVITIIGLVISLALLVISAMYCVFIHGEYNDIATTLMSIGFILSCVFLICSNKYLIELIQRNIADITMVTVVSILSYIIVLFICS